ncbi:dynamin family protein [Geodermatophilus ruber]|uniref:Dynamin family protein n=1 Tax=Geodermatophilus ruber TaxID=504800 RepID=A0A1I4BKE6_9ACTN|nr:dynamin family protein [Geodermatophilus ruber]SFK68830.1 Dynamin family protein [Geodermatophilus ruber]
MTTSGSEALPARLRALLATVAAAYAGTPSADVVAALLIRLDEPLRVAIAGRLKAGKSTLLNALIGERLAATDAGECTRVIAWYENGPAERAWAHPRDGARRQIRMDRVDERTVLQLGGLRAEDLDRIVVEVPSARLERLTLIDTPGIGSLSADVSARTVDALNVVDGQAPVADAVLYLMRHLHASDVGFLEAFHDHQFLGVTPVNAIGLLSRADEVGGGRTDAVEIAARIAANYRQDPRVRGLVQTVLPVAGLLAEAGAGLRERDHAALRALAGADESLLLSADRFAGDDGAPVDAAVRRELLAAMGLTGVRLSVALIRAGLVRDAGELARELRRRSGLDEVRHALLSQFADRCDLLKAQAALHTVERLLDASPVPQGDRLRAQVEGILAGAHELVELRLLNDLRTGVVQLPDPALVEEAEVLLGRAGSGARSRLGLPADAPDDAVRAGALATLRLWQRRGESPVADAAVQRVAAVLRRTCEGLLGATAAPVRRPLRTLRTSSGA